MSHAHWPVALLIASLILCAGCLKPPPGYETPQQPAPPAANMAEAVNVEQEPLPEPVVEEPPTENAEAPPEPGEEPLPEQPTPEVAQNAEEPAPDAEERPGRDWEGVVGRETPLAEVTEAPARERPRRAARGHRGRRAARPARAPKPPTRRKADDPVWAEIQQHNWGSDGRFPWASDVKLTNTVLSRFSNPQLSLMAMEILARRGKRFDGPAWQRCFDKRDWYYPNDRYSESWLSPIERANFKLIRSYQSEHFGGPWAPPADWDGRIPGGS